MAQNDMEIIMYKILSYLYECMKAGKHPRMEDMGSTCQMFRIPQEYWNQVMEELIDCGYVKGFRHIPTKGPQSIFMMDNVGITLKGREYLRDNSGMQRAGEFLGTAFSILLDGIVGAIIK